MIFRRLADAIREQSWFTVVLEVLIVVVGIFVGLQVNDWNQYRQDRNDEQRYLDRLHFELLNAEKLSARVLDRRIDRQQKAADVLDVVFNDLERQSLTDDECATVGGLHYFNVVVSGLSAVEELTASGRLGILLDTELRAALGALQQAREAANMYIQLQNGVSYDLPHNYPEFLSLQANYDEGRGEIVSQLSCDLPAMRRSRAFLTDLSSNADVYDSYVRDGLSPWAKQLQIVHRLLDGNLGLQHAEQGLSTGDSSTADFGWLAGCWVSPDGSDQEVWVVEARRSLAGFAVSVADSQTSFYEIMSIKPGEDGSWNFTAHPSGQAAASFAAVEIDESSVVFANPDHDYPQEIRYKREGVNLYASISLLGGVDSRSFDKIACEAQ